jgi:hypothetical protein
MLIGVAFVTRDGSGFDTLLVPLENSACSGESNASSDHYASILV